MKGEKERKINARNLANLERDQEKNRSETW